MPLHESHFPQLIRRLYETVAQFEEMFPGRRFTPDGHMVGSLAECFAAHYYGLDLYASSHQGHDARGKDCDVEIKATQGTSVSLRSGPDKLLVFKLLRDGTFEEIYNGNGARVWQLVETKKKPSNGQYKVQLSRLRKLMKDVPEAEKLMRVGAQQAVQGDGPASGGSAP